MKSRGKSQGAGASGQSHAKERAAEGVIPVIEEEVSISRAKTKTGKAARVRIEAREEKARVPVTEVREEFSIERVPVNRYVSERSAPRTEGDVVIIPVFETVAVVEERLLLKEEVRIVRQRHEIQREEEVVLHKETPVVERRESSQDDWKQESPDQ